jgi:putative membrane protein
MNLTPAIHTFLLTLAYTIFGLVVFAVAFWIIVKVTPFSIRKEIEEDQNISLAILIGSVMLGLAIIIASTIHG